MYTPRAWASLTPHTCRSDRSTTTVKAELCASVCTPPFVAEGRGRVGVVGGPFASLRPPQRLLARAHTHVHTHTYTHTRRSANPQSSRVYNSHLAPALFSLMAPICACVTCRVALGAAPFLPDSAPPARHPPPPPNYAPTPFLPRSLASVRPSVAVG